MSLFSYGQWTYKVTTPVRRRVVLRWDPILNQWQTVGAAGSKREARRLAARDAYARGLNP